LETKYRMQETEYRRQEAEAEMELFTNF